MLNVFHVYVVVDDPVVCKSLQRLLEMGNFRCHCFPSVTKLTEQMSELMDGCILLDDATSALDGLELLVRTRQAKGSFPLVLMTTQQVRVSQPTREKPALPLSLRSHSAMTRSLPLSIPPC